jgi:hypothetical protein
LHGNGQHHKGLAGYSVGAIWASRRSQGDAAVNRFSFASTVSQWQ